MPLTVVEVKTAKILDKPYKLTDEKGLYLLVGPTGARLWRLKYRIAGVEKLLALGSYPDTSLQRARSKRDAARAMLEDPQALTALQEYFFQSGLQKEVLPTSRVFDPTYIRAALAQSPLVHSCPPAVSQGFV